MGNISSANFKKSKDFQVYHNANIRPSYAIGGGLEVNRNGAEALALKKQIIEQAIDTYNRTKKPKAPPFKAKSYEWSLVVNLKESSTMQDLETLSAHFKDKYGFQCYQIAIHRDEGHIDNGEKRINHHAHLEFITLDKETGKNRFRGEFVTAKGLRAVQDEVAQILGMQRGADKRLSGAKRIEPRAYAVIKESEKVERKADLEKINDLKAENATLKDKNAEFERTRKAWIEQQNKIKEDYRALSALKQDLAKKNLTIEQVREYIENLENELDKERKAREKAENDRARLATELESKNAQNRDFAPQSSTAPDKPKTTETTQGVETTQKAEPKIDAPVKEQQKAEVTPSVEVAPKIEPKSIESLLNDFNEIIGAEFKPTIAENTIYSSKTALSLEKATKLKEKLETKGYHAIIFKNPHSAFGIGFAKGVEAIQKLCAVIYKISAELKIVYQTKELKTLKNKPKINEKSKSKQNDSYGMSM